MNKHEMLAIVERALREPVPAWSTLAWNVVGALRDHGVTAILEHGPCPKGWGLCACNDDWAPVVMKAGVETYPRSPRGHVFDGCCCDPACEGNRTAGDNRCSIHD